MGKWRTMIGLLIAGGILSMTITTSAHAATDAQKIETAKQMIHAWDTLDWARVIDLFTQDAVLHSMMMQPLVGRPAIKQRIMELAAGIRRIELKVRHIGVIDGRVFIERVDDFDYNGHAGAVPVVGVMEIENGRVRAWREYYDRSQLLEAMGAPPAAGAHR